MNMTFFRTEGKHGIWKCWKEYLVRNRVTGRGLVAPKQHGATKTANIKLRNILVLKRLLDGHRLSNE
jgi:hypothetical protein